MASREHRDVDPTEADGPFQLWRAHGIGESKLFREYLKRLSRGRDLHIIVTAESETGVGKTTLAVSLALLWDQHGWTADKAAVADAKKYSALYDNVGKGSVLILDEAEKAADSRRGMRQDVVDISQAFAAKRFKQVFGILTAPSKSWVDKRLGSSAADYWIQAQESDDGGIEGNAKVYRLREQEHYESEYTTRTETISWPILDDHREFQRLDDIKKDRLSGTVESEYVHRSEVNDIKDNYWNKATKKARYELVKAMYDFGLEQQEISDITQAAQGVEGIGRSRVSHFVNSERFDDVYKT